MVSNFLTIVQQIIILFFLILAGFICGRKKLFTDAGIKTCTNIALYLATPCMIIKSYIREFSPELLGELVISLGLSIAIHVLAIIAAKIAFPTKNRTDSSAVCHYAIIFSNAGFMALPLQMAILGDKGVFFGASYVAIFNVMSWTYGLWCMSKDKGSFSAKKLINPGVVGVVIGVIIFAFSVPVHPILLTAITHLANLNTPIPMLIIGYYLSASNVLGAIKSRKIYAVTALRLLLVPLAALFIMYFAGVSSDMLVSMTIAVSAPVAANTTMFAVMFDRDEELSVNLVSFTTIVSIITMPVIVALSQYLA